MATPAELNLVNCVMRYTHGDNHAQISQWWRENPPGFNFVSTVAGLTAFGNLVANQIETDWNNHRPDNSLLVDVVVTQYRVTGPPLQVVIPRNNPGTSGIDLALPHQCSLVMSYRTLAVGRSYRGRSYLPFIASEPGTIDTSGDEIGILPGVAAALSNNYPVAFPLADGNGIQHSMELHVYSRKLGSARPVSSVVVNTTIDTQRRRARPN